MSFGKALKISCLQVIVLDEAGLRAIRGCARVARDGGGSFHRGDRDERSTGHSRVLPRALQVLQCRSLSARVRLSLVSFGICDIASYLKKKSLRKILRLVAKTDLIVHQKNSAFFADITRSELLLEYHPNCQSKWRSINYEIVSISIIKNQS